MDRKGCPFCWLLVFGTKFGAIFNPSKVGGRMTLYDLEFLAEDREAPSTARRRRATRWTIDV
jgi:hypothetical protein